MQNGQQSEALTDFGTAINEDPENSDIYHHRGQVSDLRRIHIIKIYRQALEIRSLMFRHLLYPSWF